MAKNKKRHLLIPGNLDSLTKEWNQKLKESGFEDIEMEDGSLKRNPVENMLNNPKYRDHIKGMSVEQESDFIRDRVTDKTDYFRLAGQFLHEYAFLFELDRLIWKLHATGETVRDIGDKVGKSRTAIQVRIQKLEKIMFLKAWQEKDV